ncbi:MAG: UPF0182 family protein [Deltaproteobacteria bacterium]|nr:UPF0182 family protein [Deltaproteobacteria bacterium]
MKKKILIGFGILVALLLWSATSIYPDWLWFLNLDFWPVFWTMLLTKFGFGSIIWILLILIVSVNLYVAKRLTPAKDPETGFKDEAGYFSQFGISANTLNIIFLAFVLIVSFIIASKGAAKWDMVLRYLYQEPFGEMDPIFNKDIGFYVFSLPFLNFIRDGLLLLIIFAGGLTVIWYLKDGALQIIGDLVQTEGHPPALPKISISPEAKKHLIFLGGFIALLLAWGFHLKMYELLYSTQGPAFGASYTDVHIKAWVYKGLILVSLALAVVLFMNVTKPRTKLIYISLGVWLGTVLVFANGLPIVIQKLLVKPNELAKESPYIAYNIDFTRKAYNLNKIKEVPFEVKDRISPKDIEKENVTIQNIRIWDERPLLQTYRQIQSIRLYYDFNNVDVDRYMIDNQFRQVMLAARELVVNQLPPQANTWVNRHLIYTHGYGLASSPVNEVTSEGLPQLLIKDLPPSYVDDLKVDRPEIYYGEMTDEYVMVKTKAQEFDYPKGDKNVYATYLGKGGVHINSFVRRLLFAIEFMDPQILFTTYLGPESRIMYNRRIERRAATIAPFLDYDRDPYMVVSGGRLYWIQDAYTTSNMYPYSRRSLRRFNNKSLNYIRNSVKVTVDAYNGKVCFYMMDEKDPIVKTYAKIFPDLFKPFSEMPEDLKTHIRYPRDLFEIQAGTYTTYHMQDVQVFYNQEDLWQIPDELYGDSRQEMKPYYIIIKLPEGDKEEFVLMLPFTPSRKDNMIGWLAARSDLPHYGTLLVYKLPKEKLVYGPMQIEARVDQQTHISRELSLWGQKGSRVIRGNLLVIPVSGSFIYVEPIYLEAKQEESQAPATAQPQRGIFGKSQQSQARRPSGKDRSRTAALPELKRVIVAFGNSVIMEDELDKALSAVLEGEISKKHLASPAVSETPGGVNLGERAMEHYNKAKAYLRQGKWAEYGRELENLEKLLKEMSGKTGE